MDERRRARMVRLKVPKAFTGRVCSNRSGRCRPALSHGLVVRLGVNRAAPPWVLLPSNARDAARERIRLVIERDAPPPPPPQPGSGTAICRDDASPVICARINPDASPIPPPLLTAPPFIPLAEIGALSVSLPGRIRCNERRQRRRVTRCCRRSRRRCRAVGDTIEP